MPDSLSPPLWVMLVIPRGCSLTVPCQLRKEALLQVELPLDVARGELPLFTSTVSFLAAGIVFCIFLL